MAYLVDTLSRAAPGSVTLCALGPLTNLATALVEAPQIRGALREIVLMGGAFFERGNITPAAEFNLYVDPQAAEVVFGSGVPIVVLPRDVAVKAPITPARVAPFRALGNRCGAIVADIMEAELAYNKKRRGVEDAPMYDPTAVGYLVDPTLFGGRKVNVMVETTGQWTLGETVVDWNGAAAVRRTRRGSTRSMRTASTRRSSSASRSCPEGIQMCFAIHSRHARTCGPRSSPLSEISEIARVTRGLSTRSATSSGSCRCIV